MQRSLTLSSRVPAAGGLSPAAGQFIPLVHQLAHPMDHVTTPPALRIKRRIKRIAPLQLGKMLALLYGILGLIFIPVILLMTAVSSQLPPEQRTGIVAMGAGFALFAPILYGLMGFIGGIIGAWIYNFIAKFVGGVEVEVE